MNPNENENLGNKNNLLLSNQDKPNKHSVTKDMSDNLDQIDEIEDLNQNNKDEDLNN